MMFSFVVRRLAFLKSIPLFPQVYDSLIKLWMLIANPDRLDHIDAIEGEVLTWENTSVSLHKFGGLQFNYMSKEFAHIHSNGILDILFTREIKLKLLAQRKAEEHHIFRKTGWISFHVIDKVDVNAALELLKLSYDKNAG